MARVRRAGIAASDKLKEVMRKAQAEAEKAIEHNACVVDLSTLNHAPAFTAPSNNRLWLLLRSLFRHCSDQLVYRCKALAFLVELVQYAPTLTLRSALPLGRLWLSASNHTASPCIRLAAVPAAACCHLRRVRPAAHAVWPSRRWWTAASTHGRTTPVAVSADSDGYGACWRRQGTHVRQCVRTGFSLPDE